MLSDNLDQKACSAELDQRGHLPSDSLSSYLACMKRTLSTWHVHHPHTAPDLPTAQTVDYIGDQSKGPIGAGDPFPAGPVYFSFDLSAVYLTEAGLPAAGTFPRQPRIR